MPLSIMEVKKYTPEQDRIRDLHAKQNRTLINSFRRMIKHGTSDATLALVAELVHESQIEPVLNLVDQLIDRYANELAMGFLTVARLEANKIVSQLPPVLSKAPLDITDPKIQAALRNHRLGLIQNLTRNQRDVIRTALIEGIRANESPTQIANRFKNSLGLTRQQLQAVKSFKTALELGSRDALSRGLRNPRFDSQIERAIDENDVLSTNQIQYMLDAYVKNLRDSRAHTIAQTESTKMVNQARFLATGQVAEKNGIGRGTKTWMQTSSVDPREPHLAMVGETVPYDQPFILPGGTRMMFPGDTSFGAGPEHVINCKCGIEYNLE